MDIFPSFDGTGSFPAGEVCTTAVDTEGETVPFLGTWIGSGCKRGGKKTAELEGPEGTYVAGGGVNAPTPR
jgi:hypothetical protein